MYSTNYERGGTDLKLRQKKERGIKMEIFLIIHTAYMNSVE
jgi:hypothetical protein